jgi:hypothetical protein
VRDHADPLVSDPGRLGGTEAAGAHETRSGTSGPSRHASWATGFVDLHRARLADVVAGRAARAVAGRLERRDGEWTEAVRVVALDPFRCYASGMADRLGHATVVVDQHHAAAPGQRGRPRRTPPGAERDARAPGTQGGPPLWHPPDGRWSAGSASTPRAGPGSWPARTRVDPDGWVGAALLAKELLREVSGGLRPEARRHLVTFQRWCADAEVPGLSRLATTISRREAEVAAYHTTGLSNGPTEAVNPLTEKIRRIGHGFRNFDTRRLRLLLRCGVQRQTPPVARIRGRQPRSVA